MVEPRIDREALRKLTRPAPMSDADREARSRRSAARDATNNQPFMRGRSAEPTEAQKRTAEKPKGEWPAPDPAPPTS